MSLQTHRVAAAIRPSPGQTPDGQSRRALLRNLAAAGTVLATVPMISTSTAFADSGTLACRHTYPSLFTVSLQITRPASGQGRIRTTANSTLGGACPCGGTATVTYSNYWSMTDATTVTGTNSTLVWDTGAQTIGGGTTSFSWTIEMGIYIRCNGARNNPARPAKLCRFASGTLNWTAGTQNVTATFDETVTPPHLTGC
ncbi:MAG: hypothetical protein WCC60_17825 [Ilumatobacteraceae bacterium]